MKNSARYSIGVYFVAIAAISVAPAPAMAASSNQGERALQIINSEGFRACKALGNSGYTASASGLLIGGSGRGSGRFRLRTCFPTLTECENFISRIPNIVGKIDIIRHKSCKPR